MTEENKTAIPANDEKSATVKISLKADSGYTTQETCRISLDQWTGLQDVLHDPKVAALIAPSPETAQERDELLESFAPLIGWLNKREVIRHFAEDEVFRQVVFTARDTYAKFSKTGGAS